MLVVPGGGWESDLPPSWYSRGWLMLTYGTGAGANHLATREESRRRGSIPSLDRNVVLRTSRPQRQRHLTRSMETQYNHRLLLKLVLTCDCRLYSVLCS